MEKEIAKVQAGFGKGCRTKGVIADECQIIKKAKEGSHYMLH